MEDLREKNFEKVLSSAYDHNTFINFLREFLNDVKLVQPDRYQKVYGTFANSIRGYYHIGFFTGRAGKKVALFAIELNKDNSVENARTMQRNFVKSLLESSGCDGALAAFYTVDKPQKWRLSLVRLEYEFAKGKIKENLTPAKRYSYLVGEDEPCHTAKERLYPIFAKTDENPTLDELEAAFSVESVTNEFFEAYKEKYLELKEYLESNADFVEESTLHGFTSEQFAKKLMGQIVFLYFIQKKGWLGVDALPVTMNGRDYRNAFYAKGHRSREVVPRLYKQVGEDKYHIDINELRKISDDDEEFLAGIVKGKPWGTGSKNFMRLIFEDCIKHGLNYYDDYLEPFFYTGLNRNRGANGYFPPFHRRVPFLSGELFEELDNYDWRNNNFSIPNEMFSNRSEKGVWNGDGILDIFDRYNFTMSEDEPMEREVAIDPEMLGKVFENLLDVKDRKSKGAFYTPREIVHYMCQESLINYLTTRSGIPEEDIRKLVVYGEYFKEYDVEKTKKVVGADGQTHKVIDKQRDLEIPETIFSFKKNVNRIKELDDLLANVKVVDPATGSGAFPLGMLNEIVKTREVLTSYMMIEMNRFERFSFYSYGRKPYDLKINTIRNCIFACDIEPSAVDITKLRFYLSLVIDDHISDKTSLEFDEHTQPKPLPNLECNIICGNSLIDEFEGRQLITKSDYLNNAKDNYQMSMAQYVVDPLIKKLIEYQDKYFYAQDHEEKEQLKQLIQKIDDQIIYEQIKDDPNIVKDYNEAKKLSSKPFVLWELNFPRVFKDKGGFDIAVGNPPYIGEKGNKEIFRPIADTEFGRKYYLGKMDMFYFFFHKALDLGNENEELAFITTNYYPTAFGAKKLRDDFKERTQIRQLINFNELKIFESALGQHDMITVLTKNKKSNIISHNKLCHANGVASAKLLGEVLYTQSHESDNYDLYDVSQSNLYEGDENYIRINGVNSDQADSVGSILSKIAHSDVTLKDIAQIKQGIVSGADKYTDAHEAKYHLGFPKGKGIFVLHKQELEKLGLPQEEYKYVKRVYKNSQIRRYHIDYDDELYVFYLTKDSNPNEAKEIIKYLEQFKPILASKREAISGRLPWYSLNWARDEEVFVNKEKIVNSRRAKGNVFALETHQFYEQSDIMISVIKKQFYREFPPKYVLGVLNSKLFYLWLRNKGKVKGDMLELYGKPLEEIPLRKPDNQTKNEIIKIVDKLINGDHNTSDLEGTLNRIIYDLYNLTPKEVEIVEDNYYEE